MLRAIVRKIQPVGSADWLDLKNRIIKGAVGTFGVKVLGSGLAFGSSIMLARYLGTSGLGIYAYAITLVNLSSIPATLGLDRLVVREMAIYRTQSHWGAIAGLLRWSNWIVLAFSLAWSAIAIAVVWMMLDSPNEQTVAVVLAMTTLPLASLRNLRSGAMKGLDRVVLGQIPDTLLVPAIVLVLTGVAYFALPDSFGVFGVLGIRIFAIIVTFLLGTRWLWRSLPPEVKQERPQYEGRQWLLSALPFMFLGTLELVNARIDIVMLGGITGASAVGIYSVIVGITQLTAFIHQATLSVLAPTIATLYTAERLQQLQQLIRQSALVVFAISSLIGGIIIGCGHYLLLIFGSEFVAGATAMNILIGGQIFNALTGPVGLVLNMTGHQHLTAIATVLSAGLNVVLNALLIPQWGIAGAAIATTTSAIVINIIKLFFMQKRLKISLYSNSKIFSKK